MSHPSAGRVSVRPWALGLLLLGAVACRPIPVSQPPARPSASPPLTLLPSATPVPAATPTASPTAAAPGPLSPVPAASPDCSPLLTTTYLTSSPVWSPDGRWLLYLRQRQGQIRHGGALCGNESQIQRDAYHLLDLRSGYSHALWPDASYAEASQVRPVWSPDGARAVLLARAPQDRWRVFLLTPLGLRLEPLGVSPPVPQQPRWSPDGLSLYLAGIEADARLNITRWDLPGDELSPVGVFTLPREHELWQRWLPRSQRLLTLQGESLAAGSRVSLRLHPPGQAPQVIWQQGSPGTIRGEGLAVSPDERYAAFWLMHADSETPQARLYLADLSDASVRELHRAREALPPMDWRRGGEALAFSAQASAGAAFELYAYSPGDGQLRQLTRTPATPVTDAPLRNHDPAWSPDGSALIFTSSREAPAGAHPPGRPRPEALWRLSVASGELTRLTCVRQQQAESDGGDGEPWLIESGPVGRCP